MSTKKPLAHQSLAAIADDALEFVRYGKEQVLWLSALMRAIQLDVEHNCGRYTGELAGLGQYLGEDCANYLDSNAEKAQAQLDAVEEHP